jgi:hypothetical protein
MLLAAGANPIPLSGYVGDLDVTPDGRFLLATSNGATRVVNVATRSVVSTVGTGYAVVAGSDGTVLVTEPGSSTRPGRASRSR